MSRFYSVRIGYERVCIRISTWMQKTILSEESSFWSDMREYLVKYFGYFSAIAWDWLGDCKKCSITWVSLSMKVQSWDFSSPVEDAKNECGLNNRTGLFRNFYKDQNVMYSLPSSGSTVSSICVELLVLRKPRTLQPDLCVSGRVLARNIWIVPLNCKSWVTVSLFIIVRQIFVQKWRLVSSNWIFPSSLTSEQVPITESWKSGNIS